MKPLEIGETATLENGDVVKCVIGSSFCIDCYFKNNNTCNEASMCLKSERSDKTNVHFELVEKIPQNVEEIRKE